MLTPESIGRRVFCAFVTALLLSLPASSQPDTPTANSTAVALSHEIDPKLANGEVLVDTREVDGVRYVAARILLDETPEKTWRLVTNPYEFQGRICQRMKKLDVITDESDTTVFGMTMTVCFPIPDLKYTVETHYVPFQRFDFKRTSGSLKDFKGFWLLHPVANGTKTELTYSMFIDPGFPVPDFIMRYGISKELPNVLTGIKKRLAYLKTNPDAAEKRTVAVATASGAKTAENKGTQEQPFIPVSYPTVTVANKHP